MTIAIGGALGWRH